MTSEKSKENTLTRSTGKQFKRKVDRKERPRTCLKYALNQRIVDQSFCIPYHKEQEKFEYPDR